DRAVRHFARGRGRKQELQGLPGCHDARRRGCCGLPRGPLRTHDGGLHREASPVVERGHRRMSINITMPALSPTMEEGKLAKWHVKEGDKVSSGDVIAEIETDKATMEVESIDEGIVGKIVVPEGTEGVKVNAVIAVILADGESASDIKTDAPAPAAKAPEAPKAEAPKAEAAPASKMP